METDIHPFWDGLSIMKKEYMMEKLPYECPESETLDLDPMLDVCNDVSNPSGNTDPVIDKPGGGWEDDFGN